MHQVFLRSLSFCFALVTLAGAANAETKNILMMAGPPSHGYGSHEHYAGLKLLEESIKASSDNVTVTVVRGWPKNEKLIQQADSIVIYCDGGGRHIAMNHRDVLKAKLAEGCGLVCLHYAVEMVPGQPGDDWVDMLGGHFEVHWSVNPHWVAEFKTLPEHPITGGVEPFATDDEWYFHMRFKDGGKITPILAAVAPEHTMRRKDGAHSGNPAVRKSVAAGDKQVVAWAYDREDGGRSFGFTGGHNHWNWANDDVRRLVTNAIRWTAKDPLESKGSSLGDQPVGIDDLLKNQDFDPPKRFNLEETIKKFNLQSRQSAIGAGRRPSRKLYQSPVINARTEGHRVNIDVPIGGVGDLYLVVTDAGDGYGCDWADWIDPMLHGPAGKKSLVDWKWESATTGYGKTHKNANCLGQPFSVLGQQIGETCLGTHANSVIHFELPKGYHRLTVTGALDSGGTSQAGCGQQASVRFAVYSGAPPADLTAASNGPAADQRDPRQAIAGLEIAAGLEATLSASEPVLRSLTNLDIDDRGRVWVCDVMNYRRNNGSRPEGDRILILEDTDGDGVMDSTKTFYQGNDIDSAMGICVLGNEVIVTASPYVWRFVDEDGDDKPDRKEAMFTETGQPQHDHSAHSFLFGPDGKLYWNFGNTGKQVKDSRGNTVIDIHGRPVVDNGKPFYGGMPFRCDLDGSNFEVLAHNFRNNWETTVDSFGTLWQSDNDDDGNRGTRINFVMEHGNYGYRDEQTGAGWRDDRITLEPEIPLRHWHLNDPGVVPNMLQTGAGSPSGICVYEGRLLPERFWDQVIHCDPGPNVVRAYPATPDGAGYRATIDPLMTGTSDKWFRPADVCVAPDGSLFVTDWYDPGVGGHRQGDSDRGRLFRIAPPGSKYVVPKFDYSTVDGAIDALRNPNLAVRYKAWTALHAMGAEAEPALLKLYRDPNPRLRARALWLLGKMQGRGEHYVKLALADRDPNLRITGIRLARQLGMTPSVSCRSLAQDDSAAVRRELAVALRFDSSASMPDVWAELALAHDGKDRWYLEAIGLASDLRPQECFQAWLAKGGNWNNAAGRDVVWRVRAPGAAEALVQIINDPQLKLEDTHRYFRSLEYHDPAVRTAAI
ncbi:MAG: ThuA domain-containing protein, partial [Pirellulales bacterium]|nr:ThuA domain-containing protein [Pirellulales bacterium]